jgi:hypothetical protein
MRTYTFTRVNPDISRVHRQDSQNSVEKGRNVGQ